MDKYKMCETCKRAEWDCIKDHGYFQNNLCGCKVDAEPEWNEEEEAMECNGYREVDEFEYDRDDYDPFEEPYSRWDYMDRL